ncbi:hypothetical protein R1flu_002777 [Riccia fluitans]|uniref:Phosphatidic acid phosphatase type 2/haloperoxidase domain-containing protein n=1 Tax=Riccia fluitans TaxID=41844 RepID=A0ABD1Y728_9MARC
MVSTTPLKAVSLTHVRYERGDRLGHVLAWASLVPVIVGWGGFLSHFVFRRELQAMAFALGLILSEGINQVIKKAVKEARPLTCEMLEMCDSHGWPSSHSQFMCFFSMYLTLLALRSFHFTDPFSKYFTVIVSWPFTVAVVYSRVYLGYHSVAQIIAGSIIGLALGAIWFVIVNKYLVKFFPVIEGTALCRYLCIKDSTHIPSVLRFEYDNCRAARKKD